MTFTILNDETTGCEINLFSHFETCTKVTSSIVSPVQTKNEIKIIFHFFMFKVTMVSTGSQPPTTAVDEADLEQRQTLWVGGLNEKVTEQILYELFMNVSQTADSVMFNCQASGFTDSN